MQRHLAGDGITLIGRLAGRYGRVGARLGRFARDEDARALDARAPAHSIPAETTLGQDVADAEGLAHALWPLCKRLSARLKQASLATGRLTSVLPNARHKAPQRISRRARHHGNRRR
jgi:DNA polymerase IV